MDKKDKNKRWGEKVQEDLKGFEDVLDLIDDEKSPLNRDQVKRQDPHEIFNFLDFENKRLKKLDSFFNDKVQNLVNHPTTELLCERQQQRIEESKAQLWNKLHQDDSIYLKNLRLIFDRVFN